MGGAGRPGADDDDSSGEEDGDAEWRTAINSVSGVDFGINASTSRAKSHKKSLDAAEDDGNLERPEKAKNPGLKLYQIKAHKLLDDLLDKSLEMVRNPIAAVIEENDSFSGGIQLFGKAPPGITLDDAHQLPRKRPRILPGEEVNEKSKKFKRQLKSVAVDGADILAAAKDACQRSLARSEARDAAAKEALKREEERVAEVKRIRGEKWLPAISREMQAGKYKQGVYLTGP